MWTLEQTLKLVGMMQVIALKYNLSIGLTGSVLYKGLSEKDVDIIVYKYKSESFSNLLAFRQELTELGFLDKWSKRPHEYIGDKKDVFECKYKGMRVDMFMLLD